MANLRTEQNVFKKIVEDDTKKVNKSIKKRYIQQTKDLIDVFNEYKGYGEELTYKQSLDMAEKVKAVNKSVLSKNTIAIGANLYSTLEIIDSGFTYSYSKVSNTYLNYKKLTEAQKKITILDKINGKTYIDRLNFHSKNLDKRVAAIIQNGIRLGYSNQQIATIIRNQTGINYRHALTISRTETGRIGSRAAERAANTAIDNGLKFNKTWRQYASKSPRHDHSAMEGVTVKAGEEFNLPSGSTCQYPRLTGFAGDDINCHCEAIESFEGFEPEVRRQDSDIVEIPSYNVWWKAQNK